MNRSNYANAGNSRPKLTWVAISMLVGDRTKYFALIFGFAFATLLMAQQSSFCIGLVSQSGDPVVDVPEADIWVMSPSTRTVNGALPMPESQLQRVRGITGVGQATAMIRGSAAVRIGEGNSESVAVIGVDDTTLTGMPPRLVMGNLDDMRQPDSVFLNRKAYQKLFPNQPLELGASFEINDRRAVVRGIVETRPWFSVTNVLFTRYSAARSYVPSGRNTLSFILVRVAEGASVAAVAQTIQSATGLKAVSSADFRLENINDIITNSGIVPAFGIVVALGALVGAVIAGLTLSLFIRDNLKALGALKAIGVGNPALVHMVLTQAFLAAFIGFGTGVGLTAALVKSLSQNISDFSQFYLPWQVIAGSAVAVVLMTTIAALLSVRHVLQADPAEVFR